MAANFSPVGALDTIINDGFISGVADAWNVGIFLFLILLGIIVALMNSTGGSAAFGRWAETHVKTRVGAMLATTLLGVLIFVDDYNAAPSSQNLHDTHSKSVSASCVLLLYFPIFRRLTPLGCAW